MRSRERNTSREANPYRRPGGVYRRRASHGHSRRADNGISPSEESGRWAKCNQSAGHGGAGKALGLPLLRIPFGQRLPIRRKSRLAELSAKVWTGPPSARQSRSQTTPAHRENTPLN